jgi:DNA polymerase I
MFILLDKLYSSEGRVTYVYLNTTTQRLFYQTNEDDTYTPRMLCKDLPDWMIECVITARRKTREKKYLEKLARGDDDWGLRDQEMTEIRTVEKYDCVENKLVTLKEVHFTRPQGVSAYRDCLPTWEDNIQFLTRHGIDNNLPMGMIWNEILANEYTAPNHYPNDEIKNFLLKKGYNETVIDHFIPLFTAPTFPIDRVAIDIETRYEATLKPNAEWAGLPIISIAVSNNRDEKDVVFSLKEERRELGQPCKDLTKMVEEGKVEIRIFEKEKDLMKAFFNFMRGQPQILLTYFGDSFDLPYLKNRALHLGIAEREIPIHVSTTEKKKGTSKGFTGGIARWRGKIHIDLLRTFENVSIKNYTFGGKYQQNTLDEVSYALLGKQKIDIGDMNNATFYEMIYYNLVDTQLTLELTTFNNNLLMNLLITLMRLTNTTLPDANRFKMSTWTHNLLFSYLIQNDILVPNKKQLRTLITRGRGAKTAIKGAQYKGGQLDIRKGYFFNVLGLDFTGLYPSASSRYNICFSTVNCHHKKCKKNKVPETDYWICKEEEGILSNVLGIIKDVRAEYYKPKGKAGDPVAEAMQQTQKVLANGMIGVFGEPHAKLYCPPVPASVTAYSRNAINSAEEVASEFGTVSVYKHTDSLFLINPNYNRLTEENEEYLHKRIDEIIHLGIETEKRFQFMIVHEKANYLGVEEGAKDTSSVIIKGMMAKKRNIPTIVKQTLEKIKRHLIYITDEESLEQQRQKIIKSVRETITQIKNCEGKITDYTFKVALGKNPSLYVKTTPPHVKVARNIASYRREHEGVVGTDDRIVPEGTIIRYVWTRKKRRVEADFLASIKNIDNEKYIKILKSTLNQIFENINITDLDLKGQTQTKIDTFFG